MEFKKINTDKMSLDKDVQVSETYTREVVNGSRLEQFIGNPPEKEPIECAWIKESAEKEMKILDDWAKAVQEILKVSPREYG